MNRDKKLPTAAEYIAVNAATPQAYAATADALVDRIVAALRANPDAKVDDAWDLFKVPGFSCDDLQPTAFQAGWALAKARSILKEGSTP